MTKLNRRAWIGVAVAILGIVATGYVIRRFVVPSPIVECRIKLGISNHSGNVEVLLTNRDQLATLLDEPLRAASVNRDPARYPIWGTLHFTREDGSKENYLLFEGWFCVKQNETYYFVELGPLREHVSKVFKWWSEHLR